MNKITFSRSSRDLPWIEGFCLFFYQTDGRRSAMHRRVPQVFSSTLGINRKILARSLSSFDYCMFLASQCSELIVTKIASATNYNKYSTSKPRKEACSNPRVLQYGQNAVVSLNLDLSIPYESRRKSRKPPLMLAKHLRNENFNISTAWVLQTYFQYLKQMN